MCLIEMGMPKVGLDRKPLLDADGRPEIAWIPRPQISCAQDIAEGMAIRTDSPLAQDARKGVMEFLLINHPLDCPICDQAGECRLQEFSVEYGNAGSRFREEKVKKPKNVVIGPRVTLDDERCILCSRCIRFMKEVAKDDVLGFVDRGSYSTLTVHPGRELDSNYSLNTVDICPVGALTSRDFRFKMRVWFLKETKSFCTSCATGCNTIIGVRENTIYRQTPRDNPDVNDCWMCDYGRLDFHYISAPERLTAPILRPAPRRISYTAALDAARGLLTGRSPGETAMIVSAKMTNEELFLASRLRELLGVQLCDILPRQGTADGILMSADRNPNATGARVFGLTGSLSLAPGARLKDVVEGVGSGKIKALLVFGEDPVACGLSVENLRNLDALVMTSLLPNGGTELAHVVFPSAAFAEKRGSMINGKGRLQRLNRAVNPPGDARDDWEILRDLIQICGGGDGLQTIEDVFKNMAAANPVFLGLSLSKIGDLGLDLSDKLPSL